jgi:hypothetical protein
MRTLLTKLRGVTNNILIIHNAYFTFLDSTEREIFLDILRDQSFLFGGLN